MKKNYHDDLIERLKKPKYAVGYLNEAFKDGHREVFLMALKNVAEAHGGMTKLSQTSKIPRVSLYKILSRDGNPEIYSIDAVLHAFGLRFVVAPDQPPRLKNAA